MLDDMEVVQNHDEASWRLGKIVEQRTSEPETVRTLAEASAQLWYGAGLSETGVEGVGEPREQATSVAVARLEREPGDGATTVAGIRGGEGTFAKARWCDKQYQRASTVLVKNLKQALASEFVRRRLGHAGRARFH
jgi:hypothetical protein